MGFNYRSDTDKIHLDSKDDLLILMSLMQSLDKESERDITVFSYDIYTENNARDDDDWERRDDDHFVTTEMPYKVILLKFAPRESDTHPLKDTGSVNIKYCPGLGILGVTTHGTKNLEGSHVTYKIFGPKTNKRLLDNIKLKFLGMYKKVKKYQDETVPIQRRQDFLTSISARFPNTLIESAFLREIYDEEGGDS